jgi:hypothetical protein
LSEDAVGWPTSGWPAGSSISVQLHFWRTGHTDYEGRYVDGRGLQLHCTTCHARVHIAQPAKAPEPTEAAATIKQAGSGNQPGDTPSDYPRRIRINPDRWPYV